MSTQNTTQRSILTPLLGVGITFLILAGMWAGKSIVNLILFAGLLTLLSMPLMDWLEKKGLSTAISMTLIVFLVLILVVLIIGLIGVSATQIVGNIPDYTQTLSANSGQITQSLQERGIDASAFESTFKSVADSVFNTIAGIASNLTSFIVNGAFMLLIYAFLLADSGNIGHRIRKFVPADNPFLVSAGAATSSVGTYMLILTIVNLVIAVLDVIFLSIVGIPYAPLWGLLAFVFGYIPYIGYWVSILPPLILGFIQGGVTGAIVIIIGYWFINGMISTVIAPRFYGKGLNLSSGVSLVSVLFWGALLGPVGSILGVPLTALIKSIVLENYPGTQWLAAALSANDGSDNDSTPTDVSSTSGV